MSAGVRRCLGPGEEHTFFSNDMTNNKICCACKRKIAEIRVSPLENRKQMGYYSADGYLVKVAEEDQ